MGDGYGLPFTPLEEKHIPNTSTWSIKMMRRKRVSCQRP